MLGNLTTHRETRETWVKFNFNLEQCLLKNAVEWDEEIPVSFEQNSPFRHSAFGIEVYRDK